MKRHLLAAAVVLSTACAAEPAGQQVDDLASSHANFLELSFDGEVIAKRSDDDVERRKAIVTQLFYLSGELDKKHSAHGQFGFVELEDVHVEALEDDLERISYSAKLPVAWPKWSAAPDSYRVVMPKHVDESGLSDFNNTYVGQCGKGKYGAYRLWYDFKPVSTDGCEIAEGDALDTIASVKPHPGITNDKRPEHERFWDDGEFRVVIVHGTDASWGLDEDDSGVRQYLRFIDKVKEAYPEGSVTKGEKTTHIFDHWSFQSTAPKLGGGEGKLVIDALLASSLKSIGDDFDTRFAALSRDADLIMYGGHSGLSTNILALANKESVKPQHYQVYFIDGCSTFAYLDRSLVDRRIEINGIDVDPYGTKFLDVVVNAQPAPWHTGAASMWTVLSNMIDTEPHAYLDILRDLGGSATPVVSGEEDNPSIDE
jgi:hypothetical protein